ncbi:MAG: XdhC family protein [Hyphomicrobiaceae bacterium]
MDGSPDILDQIAAARAKGEPFAVATVVRTMSLTAAKAGAKAIVTSDGRMTDGWIGGGCARGAVLKTARDCLMDGKPRLISVQPPDALSEAGHQSGETKNGTLYARNMCASQGTMDIFIEPFLLKPELLICGASPVAVALADLAPRIGYRTIVVADAADHWRFAASGNFAASIDEITPSTAERYVVVASQGGGDGFNLQAAMSISARYVSFVGSHRKVTKLKEALIAKGVDAQAFDRLHAPAGLDIGSVTPEEIAIAILGEMTSVRRRGSATAGPDAVARSAA